MRLYARTIFPSLDTHARCDGYHHCFCSRWESRRLLRERLWPVPSPGNSGSAADDSWDCSSAGARDLWNGYEHQHCARLYKWEGSGHGTDTRRDVAVCKRSAMVHRESLVDAVRRMGDPC